MKVKVKEVAKKEAFVPIKFVITVESEKELRGLYHRMGMSSCHVAESRGISSEAIDGDWDSVFFCSVSDVMTERDISIR